MAQACMPRLDMAPISLGPGPHCIRSMQEERRPYRYVLGFLSNMCVLWLCSVTENDQGTRFMVSTALNVFLLGG